MILKFNLLRGIIRFLSLLSVCILIWGGLEIWANLGLLLLPLLLTGSEWGYWHKKLNASEIGSDTNDKIDATFKHLLAKSVCMGTLGSALITLVCLGLTYFAQISFMWLSIMPLVSLFSFPLIFFSISSKKIFLQDKGSL